MTKPEPEQERTFRDRMDATGELEAELTYEEGIAIGLVLVHAAGSIELTERGTPSVPETDNLVNGAWWALMNALPRDAAVHIQKEMKRWDIPLPAGPWEVVA